MLSGLPGSGGAARGQTDPRSARASVMSPVTIGPCPVSRALWGPRDSLPVAAHSWCAGARSHKDELSACRHRASVGGGGGLSAARDELERPWRQAQEQRGRVQAEQESSGGVPGKGLEGRAGTACE